MRRRVQQSHSLLVAIILRTQVTAFHYRILPRQHRIQFRERPAGGMNRKAHPHFPFRRIGNKQPLGHQLGQQVSAGPLLSVPRITETSEV